eukprot:6552183-Prymnesium_polylepis.1
MAVWEIQLWPEPLNDDPDVPFSVNEDFLSWYTRLLGTYTRGYASLSPARIRIVQRLGTGIVGGDMGRSVGQIKKQTQGMSFGGACAPAAQGGRVRRNRGLSDV